jgi:hypothetical protein
MDEAFFPHAEVTINLDGDEVELFDSGIRPIVAALAPASEGTLGGRALSHFDVGDAAARLPSGEGGAVDIGLVETRASAARRRILIRVWLRASPEGQYGVGEGALFMLGPARQDAALAYVDDGRVAIVKVYGDRVLGAFELELDGTLVHGTFTARLTSA